MAVGATINSAGMPDPMGGALPLPLASVVTANDDARTAQSAGDLLNPFLIDDSVFHWVKVPQQATRFYIRGRTASTLASVTTDPIVQIYGSILDPADAGSTNVTAKMFRLDNADWAATGVTLDLVASGTGQHTDATNKYTDVVPSTVGWTGGYPTMGMAYIGIAVATAAVLSSDVAVAVEVFFVP